MKKVLVFMLCFLAVFAIVSCKHEPDDPTPPAEEWKKGDLVVSPAQGAIFTQEGKFQFKIAVEYSEGDNIEFHMKCSEAVTKLDVREGGANNTVFESFVIDEDTEKDSDGWYKISVSSDKVSPDEGQYLGLTARLPDEARDNCFVAIRNLKIGNQAIDFSAFIGEEDALVDVYYDRPDKLNIKIHN